MISLFRISLLVLCFFHRKVESSAILELTNNSPAVLGSNVTFAATLLNYSTSFELIFVFDDGVQKTEYHTKNTTVTTSRIVSKDQYKAEFYFMNVTVYKFILWKEMVAANSTRFHLSRDLIGDIFVYRDTNITYSMDVDEVAVGENISMVLKLHDPSHFLENANINYFWSIDWERTPSPTNNLIYTFDSAGAKHLMVVVTALYPNNDFYYGRFERLITAKVPVNNVSIIGNPFLYHGDKLNLNVTCDGTPPFIYCFEISKGNISRENFTCKPLSTFTTCRMEILKYIQDDGKYSVGVYVSNDVYVIKRVLEVMVYSVTVKPTLSTVIIPIVCSLLALTIIAGGITYFLQQRNQMAVEVANFDFQEDSDSYTEQTFFENILNSFSCQSCRRNRLSCIQPDENDPLI